MSLQRIVWDVSLSYHKYQLFHNKDTVGSRLDPFPAQDCFYVGAIHVLVFPAKVRHKFANGLQKIRCNFATVKTTGGKAAG